MSRTSDTDAVARPLPFLSFTGVETRELSVTEELLSPAERRRDDERTLVAALSFVSGGVMSCCRAAETDRPVTVLLGALLVLALVEASTEASRAFCARVEMTDLNGADPEALGVAFRGTGAIGAERVS